jgi:hypothetical protein
MRGKARFDDAMNAAERCAFGVCFGMAAETRHSQWGNPTLERLHQFKLL